MEFHCGDDHACYHQSDPVEGLDDLPPTWFSSRLSTTSTPRVVSCAWRTQVQYSPRRQVITLNSCSSFHLNAQSSAPIKHSTTPHRTQTYSPRHLNRSHSLLVTEPAQPWAGTACHPARPWGRSRSARSRGSSPSPWGRVYRSPTRWLCLCKC